MRGDLIETPEAFEQLEQSWNRVQLADPDAGYFLSWEWLAVVLRANPGRWGVLAVRGVGALPGVPPGGEPVIYVAFLPLWLDARWSQSNAEFATTLKAAGRLSWA